jgi:hypothetical protein
MRRIMRKQREMERELVGYIYKSIVSSLIYSSRDKKGEEEEGPARPDDWE